MRSVIGYGPGDNRVEAPDEVLRLTTYSSPIAVMQVDDGGCITAWNRTAAELFGYSAEEAVGEKVHALLGSPDDWEMLEEFFISAAELGDCRTMEFCAVGKDGKKVNTELLASWLQNGRSKQSIAFAKHLGDGKVSEWEIADDKSRLEFILRSCRAAIYTAKPYGSYQSTYKSESVRFITGFEPSDFTQNPDFWLNHIHPADKDYAYREVDILLEKGEHEYEYRFLHKDGKYRWIRDEMRLVRDEAGNPKEIVGSLSDVTELRNAREQIEKSSEQLRLLAARIESIREAERRRISREIHDEFGQALTGLKMEIRWLEKHLSGVDEEVSMRMGSMLEVIDDNISLVRKMSSRLRPRVMDDLGLGAAVEWQVADFRKKTGIDCSLRCTLPEVRYDDETTTALFRILQEALTNVVRHSNATAVEVVLSEADDHAFLEVRDNGRGIMKSELEDPGSLGILSMKERALTLGGELSIDGSETEGTQVIVRVPIAASEAYQEIPRLESEAEST